VGHLRRPGGGRALSNRSEEVERRGRGELKALTPVEPKGLTGLTDIYRDAGAQVASERPFRHFRLTTGTGHGDRIIERDSTLPLAAAFPA
jgi:hypothetical protein